jgi:hypothetical protein
MLTIGFKDALLMWTSPHNREEFEGGEAEGVFAGFNRVRNRFFG